MPAAAASAPTLCRRDLPRRPAGSEARAPGGSAMAEPALRSGPDLVCLTDLAKYFDISPPFLNRLFQGGGRMILKAVDGISIAIPKGKTFSLVGESGCGKSTVARLVVGLYTPTRGTLPIEL